jgi:hypothetical protein
MSPLMNAFQPNPRTTLLASLFLTLGCGNGGPSGPPIPSKAERLKTAEVMDEMRGFDPYFIGTPLSKVVNVGKPDSYVYTKTGVKLSAYRKTNSQVKIGGTIFKNMSLYFGRSQEMQMYRFTRSLEQDLKEARESARKAARKRPDAEADAGPDAEQVAAIQLAHQVACESVSEKLTEAWGPGTPRGPGKLVWVGHEIEGSWEYSPVRGIPTCFVEVRAVEPR